MTSKDGRARTSRQRYLHFVEDYKRGRLDDQVDAAKGLKPADHSDGGAEGSSAARPAWLGGKRREYVREYLRWLRPHCHRVTIVFALALLAAGLQMIEPLFMRFIIDRVLLNDDLSTAQRIDSLHLAGGLFVGVVIGAQLVSVLKDYRQRLLNTQVMLSLRRALFERLLHLPLPHLWDMKTGGILSRITGDVDTTTGLLQMAVVSPSISVIRLIIAVVVLTTLNWWLALTALAIIPGIVLMSFASARRVRPILERGTHEELMCARGMDYDMVKRQMESHGEEPIVDFEPARSTI